MPSERKAPRFPQSTVRATRLLETVLGVLASRGDGSSLHDPSNVLIVEPFGLGDCVLVNGMIGAMQRHWRRATVHVVCRPRWGWLFAVCPNTQVHAVDVPWVSASGRRGRSWVDLTQTIRRLRRVHCDVGFDVRGDIRSQALLMASGCRERIGHTVYAGSNITLRGRLLTRAQRYVHEHRGRQNLRLLEEAGLDAPQLDYCLPSVPESPQRFAVTVHPGAGWRYKLWRPERWAELITALSARLSPPYQLLAHRSERVVLDEILRHLKVPVTVTITDDLCDLTRALRASEAYIGLDSGALHLAVALGVRVVGLYGPGIVELFHPLGAQAAMVSKQESFPCAPCLQRECLHPDATCMDAIEAHDVVRQFLDGLAGDPLVPTPTQ